MSSLDKIQPYKLSASEQELNELVHVVSHDVRAPIRHLTEFSRLLVESIEQPDANQALYAEFIQGASERLEGMIEALIALSKLYTTREIIETIELDVLIGEIVAQLVPEREQSTYNITIRNLPEIQGDRQQIRLLFFHLLANAFQYSDDDKVTELVVNAQTDEQNVLISVTDNGIGIAEEHSERIFTIFYKIPTEKNADSLGAGLCIAKKIAALHQGRIWLQSTPGQGCTFFIELPKSIG